MKNIAFLISSLSGGGAERVVATLSLNMPKEYNLYIIAYTKCENEYKHAGKVIYINSKEAKSKIGKAVNTIVRLWKIKRIKKKYKIEKCISFLDNPAVINILSRYKDKVVISVRNFKSKELSVTTKIQKDTINKLYNKADYIVALSNGVREDLINNFDINGDKTKVIYNPIDLNYINSCKDEAVEDKYKAIFEGNTIVTSGRLVVQKGQWHLIKALKKVKEELGDIKLIILGEGALETDLKIAAEELGLKDNVCFMGFTTNPFKYIKNADAFVLSSLFEGFGNVITEAMACGTVVISSDCKSGPKEILNPSDINKKVDDVYCADYGILVPASNMDNINYDSELTREEECMADAVIKFFKDKELRTRYENKLEEGLSAFNVDNIVKKWCEL